MFLKEGGESKKGGLFEKGGNKYPLRTMQPASELCNVLFSVHASRLNKMYNCREFANLVSVQLVLWYTSRALFMSILGQAFSVPSKVLRRVAR